MSDLLNQASLVMVPSGYKEDTVYSVVPSDGSGDLSFTRASNGTRVNSAGLVEVCPWNLCTYSEQFQNADWLGGGNGKPTMTDNFAEAPNGTMTASKMEAASDGYQLRQNNAQENTQMNLSVWLRTNTGTKTIQLFMNNASTASQNITVTTTWTRYEISGLVTTLAGSGRNGLNTLEALTSSNYILVWGFQLSVGLTAKPYFPTTDRLNVPRLTYQNGGGGCPSLLLEKQSTNLLTYSQDFTQWTIIRASLGANTTAPNGVNDGYSIIANTTNDDHFVLQDVSVVNATVYSYTAFLKKGNKSWARLWNTSVGYADFDLENGVVGTQSSAVGSIQSFGNGWYRCSIVYTANSTGNNSHRIYTLNGDNSRIFAGDGSTINLYMFGAQCEASSYPTSYIPTTSSSATRVADACYKTGISSLIGQTEGTIFVDWKQNAFNNSQGIYANNYNLTGSISIQIATNGTLQAYVCYAGTFFSISTSANAIQIGQRYKLGFAYKSGDCALYLNGNLIGTNTTSFAFTTTLSEIDLSNRTVFFAGLSEISVNELVQSKTRISNAELASLTTL